MMMPEETPVTIDADFSAMDGFRLGLLEDFGIEPSNIDPLLDDVVHVAKRIKPEGEKLQEAA